MMQHENPDELFAHPDALLEMAEQHKLIYLKKILPESYAAKIDCLTHLHIFGAANALQNAIRKSDIKFISALTTLLENRKLTTLADRELRNALMFVVSNALDEHKYKNTEVQEALVTFQEKLKNIRVPSLLSTSMRLAHSQRLAEKNEHIILPQELTAALDSPLTPDLSRYLLQTKKTTELIECFNHPELFRTSVTSFADFSNFIQAFPHRHQNIIHRLLTDDALFKKILTVEAEYPVSILTHFYDHSDDFLTKAFSDPELSSYLISKYLIELTEAYPLRQDEIAEKIFADPEAFRAVLASDIDLVAVFPEHEVKIKQLTKIYTQPIADVLESAIDMQDVNLILLMSVLLEGKKLNTPEDKELRNTLMALINHYLRPENFKNNELKIALEKLQANLKAIPVPSLLSTATLFVQRSNLLKQGGNKKIPEELAEQVNASAQDDLGKYFKL